MTVDIYDNNDQEFIAKDMDQSGIADALVCHFFPNGSIDFDQEVYDTIIACHEAWIRNEPTEAYEAYLGIAIN